MVVVGMVWDLELMVEVLEEGNGGKWEVETLANRRKKGEEEV